MKQKQSPRPLDLLGGIFSLCMKERDQGGKGGALKISAAVAAPAPEHEGADARDLRLAIHLPGLLDTLLLHSPACVCACDTRPLWVRLGYLAYAGRPGSDGVSHNLTIGIQCEIVART